MSASETLQAHQASQARWEGGLRPYFEYQDLGLGRATGGRYYAQVLPAREACAEPGGKHRHDVHFHWAYVLKGWAEFDFRGTGVVRVQAGDAYYMPHAVHHEWLAFSADFEQIEMYAPGEIGSFDVSDWKGESSRA